MLWFIIMKYDSHVNVYSLSFYLLSFTMNYKKTIFILSLSFPKIMTCLLTPTKFLEPPLSEIRIKNILSVETISLTIFSSVFSVTIFAHISQRTTSLFGALVLFVNEAGTGNVMKSTVSGTRTR